MSEFDYDRALQLLQEATGRDKEISDSGTQQPPEDHPEVHLPDSCDELRLLVPYAGSASPDTVRRILETKYRMVEPPEEDRMRYHLWTSYLKDERFVLKEFPARVGEEKNEFRFRKYFWGSNQKMQLSAGDVQTGRTPRFAGPGFYPATFKEITALRTLGNHRHIVTLMDVFALGSIPDDLCVVLVFREWGYTLLDVLTHCDTKRRMEANPQIRQLLFQQLLSGVEFIHSKRIIHRNLTPFSIKVSSDGVLRIGGLQYAIPAGISLKAAPHPEEDVPLVRPDTHDHLAPEVLLGSNSYEVTSDMWSVGMLLVWLDRLSPLFLSLRNTKIEVSGRKITFHEHVPGFSFPVIVNIFRLLGNPTEELFPGVSTLPYFHAGFPRWSSTFDKILETFPQKTAFLLRNLLRYNPAARFTAGQAAQYSLL